MSEPSTIELIGYTSTALLSLTAIVALIRRNKGGRRQPISPVAAFGPLLLIVGFTLESAFEHDVIATALVATLCMFAIGGLFLAGHRRDVHGLP